METLEIDYTDERGCLFTDILQSSEISTTQDWINKVVEVRVSSSSGGVVFKDETAKQYLQTINNKNHD